MYIYIYIYIHVYLGDECGMIREKGGLLGQMTSEKEFLFQNIFYEKFRVPKNNKSYFSKDFI